MPCGEAALKQLLNINLTAGGGQRVEVKVVDVNVALTVCLGVLGAQEVHFIVGLGTCGADLQHTAHGSVTVNVGVVSLHVADAGIDLGDLVDGLHQYGIGFSGAGTGRAVENICLGSGVESVVHELTFHSVLNGLNVGVGVLELAFQLTLYVVCYDGSIGCVALVCGFQRTQNGCGDLVLVIQHHASVALDNGLYHVKIPIFLYDK